MYKLCVFAGTTEGRRLVEFLRTQPVTVLASVATQYGGTLISEGGNVTVSAQRLPPEEMAALLRRERFDLVVDATHPYAKVVTEHIAQTCRETGTEYLRLVRGASPEEDGVWVADVDAAVDYLSRTEGKILLTTGSKELRRYAALPDFARRVYARVLPMEASLQACREAGLPPAQIIAMQGPFSEELNALLLRSTGARYLVTKDGGDAGGFGEKAAAARREGATLVVIGRPPQLEGLSYGQTVQLLCQRFGCVYAPEVSIVGIGPGSAAAMTGEAMQAIREADCLIGAGRMLKAAAAPGQSCCEAISPEKIREAIFARQECGRFCVVMSGDSGFFSGAKKLLPLLQGCRVRVLPGLSSLSCLCARLGTSYEDVKVVSLHGRQRNLAADVARHGRVFALVGGDDGVQALCRRLTGCGLGAVKVSVGERLSYPDERITVGTASELAERSFDPLSAVLVENSAPKAPVTHGLPDEAFLRGEGEKGVVPMTKSEVRAVCLSKLQLPADAVCYDVGAGTGSVAIEMALQAADGQVYAIEQKEAAVALLRQNRERFGAENLTVVPGSAPEACAALPKPTHAFIGGSSGNLQSILALLLEKNPHVRIVATAVTLESIGELTRCMAAFPFTETGVVSLSVAKSRKAGAWNLMTGANPVMIFTMQNREAAE